MTESFACPIVLKGYYLFFYRLTLKIPAKDSLRLRRCVRVVLFGLCNAIYTLGTVFSSLKIWFPKIYMEGGEINYILLSLSSFKGGDVYEFMGKHL